MEGEKLFEVDLGNLMAFDSHHAFPSQQSRFVPSSCSYCCSDFDFQFLIHDACVVIVSNPN